MSVEKVALGFLKGIGPIRMNTMLSKLDDYYLFFSLPLRDLAAYTGLSEFILSQMNRSEAIILAKKELEACHKLGITYRFILDEDYPRRLRQCPDAPTILYQKGATDLNSRRIIGVVGSRVHTEYAHELISELCSGLSHSDVVIVSGLALGVDGLAHHYSLKNNLKTVGVMGHGLAEVFPKKNIRLAQQMLDSGGAMVSEYSVFSSPIRENFPVRNRIVAGLVDALVVVESKERGGAMITAELANDYNRDVFAFPGSVKQLHSAGCNALIKKQKAHLISHAEDLLNLMGWESCPKPDPQFKMAIENSLEELKLLNLFRQYEYLFFDQVVMKSGLSASSLHGFLLTLQLKGQIKIIGGNRIVLN